TRLRVFSLAIDRTLVDNLRVSPHNTCCEVGVPRKASTPAHSSCVYPCLDDVRAACECTRRDDQDRYVLPGLRRARRGGGRGCVVRNRQRCDVEWYWPWRPARRNHVRGLLRGLRHQRVRTDAARPSGDVRRHARRHERMGGWQWLAVARCCATSTGALQYA